MIGREVKRQLQIDQRQILAAAAGQRGADAVQRFGSTGLRRIHQRRQLLAGLGLANALQHQRMAREFLVERLVDAGRRRGILVARHPARIGIRHPKRGIVQLVGAFETHAGIFFFPCEFEDHAGVQILEDRIPFRPGQLVDVGDRGLGVAGAVGGPARQQRRHQVGDRPAHRLIDVDLGGRVFFLLQVARADHQPRHAVVLVDGQDAVGELYGLVDIAFGERGDEGAIEQFVVLRIGAKRRAIERRRRTRIAFHAGVTRGQIAARGGQAFHVAAGGKRRRGLGRALRGLRLELARQCHRCDGGNGNRQAIETNGKHHDLPSSWMWSDSLGCATDPAASSRLTMPRLAVNRKDTGGELIGGKVPRALVHFSATPESASTVAVSWPAASNPSHRLVIGSATAFRWNPGDVAVRVLDVAGFAMDAILSVDLEARPRGLLDPFVDARGTIAI